MTPGCAVVLPIPASIAANRSAAFSRFGGSAPLAHCLNTIIAPRRRDRAVQTIVAVADSLITDVQASLAAHGLSAVRVVAADGDGTRTDCLNAAVAILGDSTLHVLIHDIHRPLASADVRDRVIHSLRQGNDVVVPALAMVDSVKAVNSVGAVTRTVDRGVLRSAQFPRGFLTDQLERGLKSAVADFDEIDYALRSKIPVTIVDGDPDAFPLDMPRDARLADAIVACRRADRR